MCDGTRKVAKKNSLSPEAAERRRARNREYMRLDRLKHPEKYKKRSAAQRLKNPEAHRARSARYYKRHTARAAAANRRYEKRRRKEDPAFALAVRLRNRLRSAMIAQTTRKALSTFALVGCSPEELARHIESQFAEGMTWENRSLWHIDHIIPVAKFDLSDEFQQKAAFHYTNLRPLWAVHNQKKSDKVRGQNLFGFAYADRIAVGEKPRRSGHRKHGTRQHVNDKHRSV